MRTKAAWIAAVAVAGVLGARPAHAQTLTCESHSGRRTYCAAHNVAGVNLRQQLGSAPCVRGRSWEFTGSRVWVDHGCRATFELMHTRSAGSGSMSDRTHGLVGTGSNALVGRRFTTSWDRTAAAASCRNAVQRFTHSTGVTAKAANSSSSNPRVSWSARNGLNGACQLSRANTRSLVVEVQGHR